MDQAATRASIKSSLEQLKMLRKTLLEKFGNSDCVLVNSPSDVQFIKHHKSINKTAKRVSINLFILPQEKQIIEHYTNARKAVLKLDVRDFQQLKSVIVPPAQILVVFQAVLGLLYESVQTKIEKVWNQVRLHVIKNPRAFIQDLLDFDGRKAKIDTLQKVQAIVNTHEYSLDPSFMIKYSQAASLLCEWLLENLKFISNSREFDMEVDLSPNIDNVTKRSAELFPKLQYFELKSNVPTDSSISISPACQFLEKSKHSKELTIALRK